MNIQTILGHKNIEETLQIYENANENANFEAEGGVSNG